MAVLIVLHEVVDVVLTSLVPLTPIGDSITHLRLLQCPTRRFATSKHANVLDSASGKIVEIIATPNASAIASL